MFKSWFHRVVQLTSLLAILPHAFSAIGQCYSFTGASTTGVPAAIYLSLPSLQSPTVGTDPAGDTTFTYSLGGSGGNSVTVSGGGVTSTASGTAITPGAASQIVVTSGPALTAVQIQVSSSSGSPYPFAATIGLSTPEGANVPVNFLPNGLTDPLPPLSSWTQTGAFIDISSASPIVFDAQVTGIGSTCGGPAPPHCAISSTTLESVPGTLDSRTKLGIGEVVLLDVNLNSAKWSITSKSGDALLNAPVLGSSGPTQCDLAATSSTPSVGPNECLTAPFSQDDGIQVTATSDDGSSCSKSFTAVPPSGIIFQRLLSPPLQAPANFRYLPFLVSDHVFQEALSYFGGDAPKVAFLRMGMWSATFITPGDVSFAKLGISEHDIKTPYSTPLYDPPVVVQFAGLSAQLLSCDKDDNYVFPRDTMPYFQTTSDWYYTHGTGAPVPFARTQTTLFPGTTVNSNQFSKEQVGTLSSTGVFQSTPNAIASVLALPIHSTWFPIDPDLGDATVARENCRSGVERHQFEGFSPVTFPN